MSIYELYDSLGKNVITASATDYISQVGEEGLKEIIKNIFLGGNVRDATEFITQKRLLNSYAAMLSLFASRHEDSMFEIKDYTKTIIEELAQTKTNSPGKVLCLWLLGLTRKGFDNIVRGDNNINFYGESFESSLNNTVEDLINYFGDLDGKIILKGEEVKFDWNLFVLLGIALGAQTLTIRGSSKSMNGKLFEKLVLGTLLYIMGFEFCKNPPETIDPNVKLFWLSNMDEHERETDATVVYNKKAISIDIGFISKGNPEISLDKVTRFGAYKEIGKISHNMSTIVIVDTIGENSDLIKKARSVGGFILQMNDSDWVLEFARLVCEQYEIKHELLDMDIEQLSEYLDSVLNDLDISMFVLN